MVSVYENYSPSYVNPLLDEDGSKTQELPPIQPPADKRVSGVMRQVIQKKQEVKDEIDNARTNILKKMQINSLDGDFWLVSADVCSMGYLALDGAQAACHKLSRMESVKIASMTLGVVGGVINIAVGLACIKQGVSELSKGHKVQGARLIFDGVMMILIGLVMFLAALSAKLGEGALLAAIVTNPLLLPVLFLLITIPITYEILIKQKEIREYPAELMNNLLTLNNTCIDSILETYINVTIDNKTYTYKDLKNESDEIVKKVFCAVMDKVEEKVGLEAGLVMYERLISLVDIKEKKLTNETIQSMQSTFNDQDTYLVELLEEWKRAQNVRLAQQICFIFASIITFGNFSPKASSKTIDGINAATNGLLAIANGIALYMDVKWPYKRNVLLSVPGVPHESLN